MAQRTAWRIGNRRSGDGACRDGARQEREARTAAARWKGGRDYTADAPKALRLSKITDHRTREGKLDVRAIRPS